MITSPSPPPPGDTTVSLTVLPPSAEAGETATPVCRCQRRGGDAAQVPERRWCGACGGCAGARGAAARR
eukprot:scaffold12315_cov57-Phaeocystis_antarctica.AAC.1